MGAVVRAGNSIAPVRDRPVVRRFVAPILSICVAGVLTGCANQPQYRSASAGGVDPRYGVAPSPRVVADGQAVPKGGGNSMVGKPYTIAGKTYYPSERTYSAVGLASWYGSDFHGRRTANGEIFDRMSASAAHPTMPLPSYARVTNLRNNHSIIVRVNDRGPYHGGRIMDVSQQVAEALDFRRSGTARVQVDYVGRASLAGSDDTKLLATLRTNGPAGLDRDGAVASSAIARSEPVAAEPVRVASYQAAAPVEEPDETLSTPAPARRAAAPLPPARPFDLGTIPGAGVPIAAPRGDAVRSVPRNIQALITDETASVPRRR